jgi:hypothetical protein
VVTAGQMKTPLSSFLITQTLEERRLSIDKREKKSTQIVKDMSASPSLRKNTSMKQQAPKKTKEGSTTMKKKTDSVSAMKKFFEKNGQPIPLLTCVPSQNIHNNNCVCVATAAAVGSQAVPEMALQVAAAGQQTGCGTGNRFGHRISAQPIRAGAPRPAQNREGGNNIGQQQQKPLDSQGCSAGEYN